MITMSYLVASARLVRLAAAVAVVGLVVGFVAVSSFAGRYGSSTPMIMDATSSDTALTAAVRQQEAAGLACSAKPALTDVVLFQREGAEEVTILTFDQAIEASSARAGWIRRYCVAP
jgi:hypothetical protein